MLTETITWRPIAEGLPDADLTVLIACDTKFHSEPVWIGFHDGEAWREANGEPAFVTHWAQLPGAPAGVPMVGPLFLAGPNGEAIPAQLTDRGLVPAGGAAARAALRRLHDWALAQQGDCMFSGDHPIAQAAAVLAGAGCTDDR